MKLHNINKFIAPSDKTGKMPVLFLGHGNPMNAIEVNEFTEGWSNSVKNLPDPAAVLCISAHWETGGTYVTAMERPKTIHDFGGFPEELYNVVYPAPGKPVLAHEIQGLTKGTWTGLDEKWGFDHGCWSILKHMYPKADIPVVQLSLDYYGDAPYHYAFAKTLAPLREKGILIVGSGNIVHNLMKVAWNRLNEKFAFDWATEANEKIKSCALSGDHEPLINYKSQGMAMQLAVPTPDHFLPLLYALALKGENERITVFNDKPVAGSLTMTCFKIEQV
jgi:4,5-DOPA dioxygenase extradiol